MQFPGQCSLEQPLAILAENSDTYLCFHEALLKFNTPQVESPSFLTWSLIQICSAALFDIQINLLPLYFHSQHSLNDITSPSMRITEYPDNLLCKSIQKAVCTHSRATFFLPEQQFSRCTDAPDFWTIQRLDSVQMMTEGACLYWLGAMHNTVPTLCCTITFVYELQYPVIHFTISAEVLNSPQGLPRDSSEEELRLSCWM